MKQAKKPMNPLLKGVKFIELVHEISNGMTNRTIEAFLHVAYHEEIYQSDLTELLDIHQASVSRHVALLSGWNRHREEGLGLIDYRQDPSDRRKQIIFLTDKGKRLKRRIEELL